MAKAPRFLPRLVGPGLGALVIAIVLAFAFATETFRVIELKLLDLRFGLRPPLPRSPRILHIDIDDSSINSMGRFPWPRDRHAHLIDLLSELGAAGVAFDVTFEEAGKSGVDADVLMKIATALIPDNELRAEIVRQIPLDDEQMAEAIERFGKVILPCRLIPRQTMTPEDAEIDRRIRETLRASFADRELELMEKLDLPREIVEQRLISQKESVACEVAWNIAEKAGLDNLTVDAVGRRLIPDFNPADESAEKDVIARSVDHCRGVRVIYERCTKRIPEGTDTTLYHRVEDIRPPRSMFARGAASFGAANALPDSEDGVVRRVPLLFVHGNRFVSHLSLAYACWALGTSIEELDVNPGQSVVIHPKNDLAGSRDPIVIPVDRLCRTLVNWTGTPGTSWVDIFHHLPFGELDELWSLRHDLVCNDQQLREYDKEFCGSTRTGFLEELHRLELQADLPEDQSVRRDALREERRRFEDDVLNAAGRWLRGVTDEQIAKLDAKRRRQMMMLASALKTIPSIRETRPRLLAMAEAQRSRLKPLVEGQFCIIGMTASGSTDLKPTPIDPLFPGVGVHSAIINSILQRRFVREAAASATLFGGSTAPGSVGGWVNILLVVVVGMGVGLVASYFSMRWAALASLGLGAAYTGVSILLFSTWGYAVTLAGPLIAGFLSYAVIAAYRQLTEERQKRQVRNAFQHYLSPTVVEEVLKDPETLKLGGQRKELTVFFSDVADFTPIAEGLAPEELVVLLNEYLSDMSDVILETTGYINKYEGDAIMAVFGAPLEDPRHAQVACAVALESQRRLAVLREKLKEENRPIIRARIGINSGIMIVGNMGSRKQFDYTVMGDNVNVGARLESAGKPFGVGIIIGENTWEMVKDKFEARRLGLVHVKGKKEPVGAYELLGEKGRIDESVARIIDRYNEGLAAYAHQRWIEAIDAFQHCLKLSPDDGPTKAYLSRCREIATDKPIPDWDGTFRL